MMEREEAAHNRGEERRQYRRIDRKFVAQFKVRPHENADSAGWDIVTVRNLGAGGILFNYDKGLEVGLFLDFRINFPAAESPIECVGRVLRVDKPVEYGVIPVAAVFTEISDENKDLIEMVAEKLHLGEPTGTILDKFIYE